VPNGRIILDVLTNKRDMHAMGKQKSDETVRHVSSKSPPNFGYFPSNQCGHAWTTTAWWHRVEVWCARCSWPCFQSHKWCSCCLGWKENSFCDATQGICKYQVLSWS